MPFIEARLFPILVNWFTHSLTFGWLDPHCGDCKNRAHLSQMPYRLLIDYFETGQSGAQNGDQTKRAHVSRRLVDL